MISPLDFSGAKPGPGQPVRFQIVQSPFHDQQDEATAVAYRLPPVDVAGGSIKIVCGFDELARSKDSVPLKVEAVGVAGGTMKREACFRVKPYEDGEAVVVLAAAQWTNRHAAR